MFQERQRRLLLAPIKVDLAEAKEKDEECGRFDNGMEEWEGETFFLLV